MNAKYRELRARYSEFEYEAFHHEWTDAGLRLWFDFRMGEVEFHPEALFETRPFLNFDIKDIDRMVFDIGMIELISYWKCACPPTVKVSCGTLTDEQIAFWKKLYWNGLGEFFYTNGIAETQEAFLQVCSGECVVDSTGSNATHYPLSTIHSKIPDWNAEGMVLNEEMVLITQTKKELQEIMWNYVGIVRSDLRLQRAFDRLNLIFRETEDLYNRSVLTEPLSELRNLIACAYLIIKMARARRENVGLHYSLDLVK